MGRRNKNSEPKMKPEICKGATLREENSGKKEADASSTLKMKYLQKLATWAGGEGGIPPLGALFGRRLAAVAEASGVPLDHSSSLFCQRCESILQPGYNCKIRIEKCKDKKRKRSKAPPVPSQNYIIYFCNFCHHRNPVKGAIKGQVRELISSRESKRSELSAGSEPQFSETAPAEKARTEEQLSMSQSSPFARKANDSTTVGDLSDRRIPLQKSVASSRKAGKLKGEKLQFSGNSAELGGSGKGSGRRKRRAWSSLKDIVERQDAESIQNVAKLVIPFFL